MTSASIASSASRLRDSLWQGGWLSVSASPSRQVSLGCLLVSASPDKRVCFGKCTHGCRHTPSIEISIAIITRYHRSLSSFAHLFHVQVSWQASGAEDACTSPLCV